MSSVPGLGFVVYVTIALALGVYFAFAAVRGDLGALERIEARAQYEDLVEQRDDLKSRVDALANKTRRLSDGYLDLDLLDERARSVLGYMRADELVIR